jgi:hypothetical protein
LAKKHGFAYPGADEELIRGSELLPPENSEAILAGVFTVFIPEFECLTNGTRDSRKVRSK